jgi:hypothetical protein
MIVFLISIKRVMTEVIYQVLTLPRGSVTSSVVCRSSVRRLAEQGSL